jgi:hypothetical protein
MNNSDRLVRQLFAEPARVGFAMYALASADDGAA